MNWEPTLHSVFGEISRQLKDKSNIPQETKVKTTFYLEGHAIKARLIGFRESISLIEIDELSGEPQQTIQECNLGAFLEMKNLEKIGFLEKLEYIYHNIKNSYEKYGHYKY